jgi:hypothetical protein
MQPPRPRQQQLKLCRTSTHDVEQEMQLRGVQERCAALENTCHRARPPTRGCRQYLR